MDEQIKIEELNDTQIAKCADCGRWEYLSNKGGFIRHSSRCDTPQSQYQAAPVAQTESPRNAGKYSKESPGSGLTNDELYDDYKRGYISQSDAMNTDF